MADHGSTAGLFDRLAARYDAWREGPAGAVIFPAEAGCLRPLLAGLPRPWAEIGAGSGRFAAVLYQPPSDTPVPEPTRDGDDPAAGFTCWRAVPRR